MRPARERRVSGKERREDDREVLYAHLNDRGITRFLIGSSVPERRTPIDEGNDAQGLARSDIRDYADAVFDVRKSPDERKIRGYGIDLSKVRLLYDTKANRI